MTPAIRTLKKSGMKYHLHSYEHDPSCQAYGEEAVDKLGLPPAQVFKTLVVECDDSRLTISVIPVAKMLDLKAFARAAGAKKAKMAEKKDVERTTGYVLGGVSPIGQKKRLATFIDESAQQFATIFISGGKRGLDIELASQDLCRLTTATFAAICK
jgi:Cys-tRNA(Pro)/Cys-tRNA(Cys) deacylase